MPSHVITIAIDSIILLFGMLGLLASLYAIHVERKARKEGPGKAACDINNRMSCSSVLTSKYAKMTGLVFSLKENHPLNVPNTYFGVLFYLAIIIYPMFPFTMIPFREVLLFGATLFSVCFSFLLAYILYFKLNDFCIVCVTTYIINAVLFFCAYRELFH